MAAKKQEPTKAVEVAQNPLPAVELVSQFAEEAGKGFEGADRDSYLVPFIVLLQKTSPQCDEDNPLYVTGAKPGDFYNTATGEIFHNSITVIPVCYERKMVEWIPRTKGGGFRGAHAPEDINLAALERDEAGRFVNAAGNHIMDTRYHFCLMVNQQGVAEAVVVALSSTQIKKSRGWMTAMSNLRLKGSDGKAFTPPTFCRRYILTAVSESNEKGNWKGVNIEPGGFLGGQDLDLYEAAKELRRQVQTGAKKASDPVPMNEDVEEY